MSKFGQPNQDILFADHFLKLKYCHYPPKRQFAPKSIFSPSNKMSKLLFRHTHTHTQKHGGDAWLGFEPPFKLNKLTRVSDLAFT